MHDSRLRKDPSTVLEDADFAMAAKMSLCVHCVRVRREPYGGRWGWGGKFQTKAWEKLKQQRHTIEILTLTGMHSIIKLKVSNVCYLAKTTEGSVVPRCGF